MSCRTAEVPFSFCPGCSHGQVVDALGAAIDRLDRKREQVVLVSDIGCVGLVDKHFDVNTFHGLHGRSVTYGVGLKLARPELTVVVAIGDGGTGIGGHHLIQAARRNIDLTVVVFNNFNYGMTGGEHSATTPMGARTSSTPMGNVEAPLDLCALVTAAGAGFTARMPAFDKELPALLERAVRHPGFALVDVWEICSAYFMPANQFKKQQLLELASSTDMAFGVLREQARPSTPPALPEPPRRLPLEPTTAPMLTARCEILIAGAAGQKIKSAATTLGRAAIRGGLQATQKDDYPITVKTGHSVSELVLSPQPIHFTGIEAPHVAVLLAPEGLARVRPLLAAMSPSTVIYADAALDLQDVAARVVRVDYRAGARNVGKDNLALWAVGHLVAHERLLPAEVLLDTLRLSLSASLRDAGLAAAQHGLAAS